MWFLAFLISIPAMCSKVTQNCIWVPIGYFQPCAYTYHYINQERESTCNRVYDKASLGFHISIFVKKSPSLCLGPKTINDKASYEVQYGCEKRNFEYEAGNICCTTSDISSIHKYFRQTWVYFKHLTITYNKNILDQHGKIDKNRRSIKAAWRL